MFAFIKLRVTKVYAILMINSIRFIDLFYYDAFDVFNSNVETKK